ncbi:hypothetical protein VYU27_004531 [Nannochloropsis oceanica]
MVSQPSLPATLGPEHVSPLYSTLLAALDTTDPAGRHQAEEVLRAFETVPNFLDVLAVIIQGSEADVDNNARLLAVLLMQNVVRRHWRNAGSSADGEDGLRLGKFGGERIGELMRRREGGGMATGASCDSPHAMYLQQQQRQTRPVSEEEKARFRAFLLSRMTEPHDLLAKNTAHVLAKVVRADWPRKWPDFFPQLLAFLPPSSPPSNSAGQDYHQEDDLQTIRVIHALHRVTKELAGKGLLADKMAFQGMARLLFPIVYQHLWRSRLDSLLRALEREGGTENLIGLAQIVKTCTKILYFLSVQHADALDPDALLAFFHDAHGALRLLLTFEKELIAASLSSFSVLPPVLHQLAKVTKNLSALIVETQSRSPLVLRGGALPLFLHFFYDEICSITGVSSSTSSSSFCSSSFAFSTLSSPAPAAVMEAMLWDPDPADPCRKFYLNACAFLGNCLTCPDYQHSEHASHNPSFPPSSSTSPSNGQNCGTSSKRGSPRSISFAADGERPPCQREMSREITEFYTEERLLALYNLLLASLLRLRHAEMEEWREAPEEFMLEEEQRRPDDDLQAAAEHLFLAMFDARRDVLGPHLAAILSDYPRQLHAASLSVTSSSSSSSASTSSPLPPPEVCFWDAVYLLLGVASYSLRDFLDLPSWYTQCFIPMMRILLLSPSLPPSVAPSLPPILLRRLLYLVACAAPDVPAHFRGGEGGVFHLFSCALDPNNPRTDLVAALQAIEAVSALLHDWTFAESEKRDPTLPPFLGLYLTHVYRVIETATEMENKRKALGLINLLLKSVVDHGVVASFAPVILGPLPGLWTFSGGGGDGEGGREGGVVADLRISIMQVLIGLLPRLAAAAAAVESNNGQTQQQQHQQHHLVSSLLLPLLTDATDTSRPEAGALLEDALRLWHTTFLYLPPSPPSSPSLLLPLLPLLPRLPRLLEHHGFELIKPMMTLLEDYIVVLSISSPPLSSSIPQQQLCFSPLCDALSHSLQGVAPRGLVHVTRVMETFLIAFPEAGIRALINSNILSFLLDYSGLHSPPPPPSSSSQLPKRLEEGEAGRRRDEGIQVQYLSLIARALLTAPRVLLPLLHALRLDVLLVVDSLLVHFDHVPAGSPPATPSLSFSSSSSFLACSSSSRRKLWCLCLLFLLGGGEGGREGGELEDLNFRRPLVMGVLQRLEQVLSICVDVIVEAEGEAKERQEQLEEEAKEAVAAAAAAAPVAAGTAAGGGGVHAEVGRDERLLKGMDSGRLYGGLGDELLLVEDATEGGGEGGGGFPPHPGVGVMVVERGEVVYMHREGEALRAAVGEALGRAGRVVGEEVIRQAIQAVHPSIWVQVEQQRQ